jgi:dihydrofolate reductase
MTVSKEGPPPPSKKRLLRVSLAVSLDGFIASEDGTVAWLNPYMDAAAGFGEFMKQIGGAVMGRTTYDHARKMGSAVGGSRGRPTWVLTHRPIEPVPRGVIPWSGSAPDFVREIELRNPPGDVWFMGGGKSLVPFLEAGLIDRLELALVPVVLGKGIPLFPGGAGPSSLRLVETKTFKSGVVALTYEPLPSRAPSPSSRASRARSDDAAGTSRSSPRLGS